MIFPRSRWNDVGLRRPTLGWLVLVVGVVVGSGVGNGDGGLQTFLETLELFHVKDLQTTMQLHPGKDGGTVTKGHLVELGRTVKNDFVMTLGAVTDVIEVTGEAPRFAVVGRVNKGKSSIVATLAEDDSVRIDASMLRAKAVGEGGNLGFTLITIA